MSSPISFSWSEESGRPTLTANLSCSYWVLRQELDDLEPRTEIQSVQVCGAHRYRHRGSLFSKRFFSGLFIQRSDSSTVDTWHVSKNGLFCFNVRRLRCNVCFYVYFTEKESHLFLKLTRRAFEAFISPAMAKGWCPLRMIRL